MVGNIQAVEITNNFSVLPTLHSGLFHSKYLYQEINLASDPDALKDTLKGSAVPSSRGTRPTDCFTASHKFYSSREAVRPIEAQPPKGADRAKGKALQSLLRKPGRDASARRLEAFASPSKLLSLRLAPQTQRWTRAFGSPVSEGDDGASAPLRAVRRQAQGNADQDTRELGLNLESV